MEQFTEYEKELIKQLIAYDKNRDKRNNYIGISVLGFLDDMMQKMDIYISYKKDENMIMFEYSLTQYEEKQIQNSLLNNQRNIIYLLHLIHKLSKDSYIVCIDLNEQNRNIIINAFPQYGINKKYKGTILFEIDSLQKTFSDILFQAVIITDDLERLVKYEFKTILQRRHEDNLNKMQIQIDKAKKTLHWTRCAFFAALLPVIIAVISTISNWINPKDISIEELKTCIDNRKFPRYFDVNLIKDTLFVFPVEIEEKIQTDDNFKKD